MALFHVPQCHSWESSLKAKLTSHCCCSVVQLYLTPCDPMGCNPPGSSVHGILQSRIRGSVTIPFSRGSFWPRNRTNVSCIADIFFSVWTTRKPNDSLERGKWSGLPFFKARVVSKEMRKEIHGQKYLLAERQQKMKIGKSCRLIDKPSLNLVSYLPPSNSLNSPRLMRLCLGIERNG